MTSTPPQKTAAEELIGRLEQIDEAVPLEDAEVELLLKEAGIDSQAALKSAMDIVAEAEQNAKKKRYALIEKQRVDAIRSITTTRPQRSRAELQQRILYFQKALPRESQPQAMFKGLESMPDEDLAMIVAEFELLTSSEHGTK